jgi:hypothetical protein
MFCFERVFLFFKNKAEQVIFLLKKLFPFQTAGKQKAVLVKTEFTFADIPRESIKRLHLLAVVFSLGVLVHGTVRDVSIAFIIVNALLIFLYYLYQKVVNSGYYKFTDDECIIIRPCIKIVLKWNEIVRVELQHDFSRKNVGHLRLYTINGKVYTLSYVSCPEEVANMVVNYIVTSQKKNLMLQGKTFSLMH